MQRTPGLKKVAGAGLAGGGGEGEGARGGDKVTCFPPAAAWPE